MGGRGHWRVGVATGVGVVDVGGAYCIGQLLFLLLFLLHSPPSILPQVTAQRPPHLGAQCLQGLQPGLQEWRVVGKGSTEMCVRGRGPLWPHLPPQHTHTPGLEPPTCRARSLLGLVLGPSIPRSFRRRNLRK